MPIEIKGRYLRIRIQEPRKFSKLRTIDVGRPGGTKLIRGTLKGSNLWTTQAELFELSALKSGRKSTWTALMKRMDYFARKKDPHSITKTKRLLDSRGIKMPADVNYP